MFGESLFLTFGKRKARATWLTLPLSLGLHVLAVAGLVLPPLISAGGAPEGGRIRTIALLAPAPVTPPVQAGRKTTSIRSEKRTLPAEGPKTRQSALLFNPVIIPDGIPDEVLPLGDSAGSGIDWGVEGGVIDGVEGGAPLDIDIGMPAAKQPIRVGLLQKPRKLHEVVPDYPEPARLARIQGVVVIEAATDVYGRVATARVVSGNALLNEAALRAVRQWMYEPYVVGGVPHPVIFTVTVTFALAAGR